MLSAGRQDGARQQADVTDPCRTSGLRRAGKRGSARSNTSWRCSQMRRRAISRLSATLLVAAALGLGVAAAHAGPCSSRIAQFEQAVRQSAGNPNAGPMAPQSIGAQLDANRRLPRSDAPSSRRKRHSRRPWRAPSGSINKEIELGVRGRWPPPGECTICDDRLARDPFQTEFREATQVGKSARRRRRSVGHVHDNAMRSGAFRGGPRSSRRSSRRRPSSRAAWHFSS